MATAPKASTKTYQFGILEDRIAILPDKAANKSAGGIHLPEGAEERAGVGTVVAVGPGRFSVETFKRVPMTIAIGMRVRYDHYQTVPLPWDGEDLLILREPQVIAIIG